MKEDKKIVSKAIKSNGINNNVKVKKESLVNWEEDEDEDEPLEDQLKALPLTELKDILKTYGLPLGGKKPDIIKRIMTSIPFPEYECPDDVNYADDRGCGINGSTFSLKLAPSPNATCRRCLVKIEQGRSKISFMRETHSYHCIEQSFHLECFSKKPPLGISNFNDVKLEPGSDPDLAEQLQTLLNGHNHDPSLKDTPRRGGEIQEFRLNLRAAGFQINGRVKTNIFEDEGC